MKAHCCWSVLMMLVLWTAPSGAQVIGDSVRLSTDNPQGVPVHPAAGDNSYVRWANGTIARVTSIDAATGWFQVQSSGKTGFVTKRYLTVIQNEDDDAPDDAELPTAIVGTWNLEWFKDGKARGFPENTLMPTAGPSYGSRTDDDYREIAAVISTRSGSAF